MVVGLGFNSYRDTIIGCWGCFTAYDLLAILTVILETRKDVSYHVALRVAFSDV